MLTVPPAGQSMGRSCEPGSDLRRVLGSARWSSALDDAARALGGGLGAIPLALDLALEMVELVVHPRQVAGGGGLAHAAQVAVDRPLLLGAGRPHHVSVVVGPQVH